MMDGGMQGHCQGDAAYHREQRCNQDCNQGRECDCVEADLTQRLRTMQALEHDADAVLEAADEIERLRQQRDELASVVNKCADKFHDYAELHSMKEPTPENLVKVERNLEMARMCDEALAKLEGSK